MRWYWRLSELFLRYCVLTGVDFFFFLVGNGLTVLSWIELICGTSYSFICIWTTGGMELLKVFVVDIETWQIDWGYHLRLKRVVDVAPIISWFCYKQLFFFFFCPKSLKECNFVLDTVIEHHSSVWLLFLKLITICHWEKGNPGKFISYLADAFCGFSLFFIRKSVKYSYYFIQFFVMFLRL